MLDYQVHIHIRLRNKPLPTFPYRYNPLGAGGAVGRRPTSESNFLSRLRYETHFPTPGSTVSAFLLNKDKSDQ